MKQKISIYLILISVLIISSAHVVDPVFSAYKTEVFTFRGHEAKIVFPNKQHEEGYWIWRARFWAHEPQLDLALLEKGFHLAYIDVSDLYGSNEAVELWDAFYDYCTSKFNLNSKVVLEGMSRGGLMVYNWASKNTDKVFCIYADAPVCDIKSWPGGLYSNNGSEEDWDKCLKTYHLDSSSVLEYKDIPIYNCVKIAEAGIPVIHVCGLDDVVVPYAENTALLAENFIEAGGEIKIIGKEGVAHHPHSLKDPTPILDFILKAVDSAGSK